MSKLRIFCVANQKGGVGKTTTTVNLAAGLAQVGQRVLAIDLDPQGNATMGSGIDKRALPASVYDVLLESAGIAEARQRSAKGGYDIVGANRELAGAEVELVTQERRERRLKKALLAVRDEYDFVLIDCPPSLSLLTLNGLVAAHGVIVPMQCEYFALEGLSDLVNTIKQVHANLNPDLQLIGLLRVMFDPRITLQQNVSDQLKAHFGEKVFDTVIPRNVRLAEAPSYGQPGVVFDPSSRGAQAFVEFAHEIVPGARRMAFILNPDNPMHDTFWSTVQAACATRNLTPVRFHANRPEQYREAGERLWHARRYPREGSATLTLPRTDGCPSASVTTSKTQTGCARPALHKCEPP